MKKAVSATGNPGEIPFEEALERLEGIVSKMEEGKLPLDQMIKCFEEGTALSKLCDKKLKSLERKIEILVKENAEGGEWKDIESDGEPADSSDSEDEEEAENESTPAQKPKKGAVQEDLLF